MSHKVRALVLMSGGLDSMLAARLLMEQGIEVVSLTFESNFFNAAKAKKAAEQLGIEHKIVDIRDEELGLVKNPPSGYGKNLNPCIDCHSLMIKKAGQIAKDKGFDVIASGEVLGQRPFSQNKNALEQVRNLSGVDVLRPLSAKLLHETEVEKNGLVTRGKLKGFRGRTREGQMELVKKYGIKDFPSPAGGCLLTDPEFCERLNKMLGFWPDCDQNDIELLKWGRVYWLRLKNIDNKKVLVIVGRKMEDNENLEKLAKSGDYMLELKEIMGPTSLIRMTPHFAPPSHKAIGGHSKASRGKNDEFRINNNYIKINVPEKLILSSLKLGEEKSSEEIINLAGLLTGYYSTKARGNEVEIIVKHIVK